MSYRYYSENEEINFEESLNQYEYLFKDYESKPPTLEEALIDMFRNSGLSEKDSKEIYDHLKIVCEHRINEKWNDIHKEYENISKNDALIISSYTYEVQGKFMGKSPSRLLNTNLVATNRKNGVINVEKYLFLFLRALRGLKKYKYNKLFRCITCNVKLEKDPNNDKYIPYENGNQKTFWAFTSTYDNESQTEDFLGNGEGTKFKIEGNDLWGYDIFLFNVYNEKEKLLEPERKYVVENVTKGKITEITCKIIDNPQVLDICKFKNKIYISKYYYII